MGVTVSCYRGKTSRQFCQRLKKLHAAFSVLLLHDSLLRLCPWHNFDGLFKILDVRSERDADG